MSRQARTTVAGGPRRRAPAGSRTRGCFFKVRVLSSEVQRAAEAGDTVAGRPELVAVARFIPVTSMTYAGIVRRGRQDIESCATSDICVCIVAARIVFAVRIGTAAGSHAATWPAARPDAPAATRGRPSPPHRPSDVAAAVRPRSAIRWRYGCCAIDDQDARGSRDREKEASSATVTAKRASTIRAREFMDDGRYDRAVERFTDVVAHERDRAPTRRSTARRTRRTSSDSGRGARDAGDADEGLSEEPLSRTGEGARVRRCAAEQRAAGRARRPRATRR